MVDPSTPALVPRAAAATTSSCISLTAAVASHAVRSAPPAVSRATTRPSRAVPVQDCHLRHLLKSHLRPMQDFPLRSHLRLQQP
jgi:hypothetical protein